MLLDEASLLHRSDSRLDADEVAECYARGQWRRVALHHYLRDAAQERPDAVAVVSYGLGSGQRRALTYRQYEALVDQLATGLRSLGVRAGDRVAVMLPNRHEFGVAIFAINRVGAIYSGIPATYGQREAAHVLRTTGASVLITQDRLRGRDLLDLARTLRGDSESLRAVVVCPEGDANRALEPPFHPWDSLLGDTQGAADGASPGAVCHIGFTSGTSGPPKGVMNTHQTLDYVLRGWVDVIGAHALGAHPVNLLPSPVGHHSGFLWGVLMSAYLRGTAVFMDRWVPDEAVRIVEDEQVGVMVAAPTFLQDLVEHPEATAERGSSWRVIAIPGAPIPRGLVPAARARYDCFVCPSWGMTEWGIGISASPAHPVEKVDASDGAPVPGCEIRVVDDAREPVVGEEGDLQMRGPGLFVGYLDRPDAMTESFQDGWFNTGDRALMDDAGFIEIRGRTKDIIIRGGENIPVPELENMLFAHPAVREVTLVGIPDPRLGERACAVIVPRDSSDPPTLESVCAFLRSEGVSKHYLPERVEVVDALPKTASGKIRKVELRASLTPPEA